MFHSKAVSLKRSPFCSYFVSHTVFSPHLAFLPSRTKEIRKIQSAMASLFPPWFYACRRRRSSIRGKRSRPYRTKRKKHYAALRESKNRKRNSLYASYVSYIVSSKLSYAWDYDFDPLTAARHSLRVFYIHEISESNRTPRGREERKVSRISRSLNRFLVNFVSFEHQHAYDPLIKFLCGQKVGESSYGEKCRVKSNVSYAT